MLATSPVTTHPGWTRRSGNRGYRVAGGRGLLASHGTDVLDQHGRGGVDVPIVLRPLLIDLVMSAKLWPSKAW